MLKKLLLVASLTSSFLYADYYTATDSTLNSDKTLTFGKKLTLVVSDESIKVTNSKKLDWINFEPKQEKTYEKITLKDKDGKETLHNVFNFAYLLRNSVRDKLFALKTSKGFLIVKTEVQNKSISTKVKGQESNVRKYEYEVEGAFDKNYKEIDVKEKDILSKYLDNRQNLLAINILDDGLKKLTKSQTPELSKFLQEKKSRNVTVKNGDFAKEKLFLTYVSTKSGSQKRMNLSYEMKKKNIKVVLKAPNSLFDPEFKGSSVSEHVGIMRDTTKALFEMKKVEINSGSIDLTWINNPKKSVVVLSYLNAGEKDKKILSKRKGQQFYAIEGTIYLATWMANHNADSRVFTFMNGALPFDVTMTKTANKTYEMQKKSQTIYKFELNNHNLVKQISYPAYEVEINLEQVDNETTLRNKEYLKSYMRQNNIVLVKE